MSARSSSRLPSAAALLAAGVLTSAAAAQSPGLRADPPAAQSAPAAAPARPSRLYDVPMLIEEEQVSEHADRPYAAPPLPAPPRAFRGCGMPECDRDEARMAPEEMALRCLLFTVNPFAAFLPLPVAVQTETLPAPTYLQHPPQYIPPSPAFPLPCEGAERLEVMPVEVEPLDVMPQAEESEIHYELLAPWTDSAGWFKLPALPRADILVGVREGPTGSLLFGIGAEINRTGTITVTTEPQSETKSAPAPGAPEAGLLPPPRPLSDGGVRPIPTPYDIDKYRHYGPCGLDDPTFTFDVIAGHTRLLHLKEAPARIQIGDRRVSDYTVLGPATDLLLNGASVGGTTMTLWFGDRADPAKQTAETFQVNVLPDPDMKRRQEDIYKALQDEINKAFPDAHVRLTLAGDKLVVSGHVKDAAEADRIVQILTRGGNEDEAKKHVINLLAVPQEKQIQLRCTLASVNRRAARDVGLGCAGAGNGQQDGAAPNLPLLIDHGRSRVLLNALRADGHARILAAPNHLVALNGRPATIFTGGEFPVPVVTGATCLGLEGVSNVPLGATLTFTPVITDHDRIHLTVSGNVAALGSVAGGNASPIVQGKTICTEVELHEGQTFCLGGLLPPALERQGDLRLLGDLPLAGNFFRSEANDSELVLLVTPTVIESPQVEAKPVPLTPAPLTKQNKEPCAHPADVPQVQVNLLVAEVAGKAAGRLKLVPPGDGPASRWVIEVADPARQKALEAGLVVLREKGRAKLIAEPRLVTLSGQQASFLSGGEQAVPVATGLGQTEVRFEEFGTRVTCQPTVLPDGTIRLEVEPEVSELCGVAGGCAEGVVLPGRSSQGVHTTANVAPGHTLVVSGPKAGGDSRLVICVTPSVVEPPAPAAPGVLPQMIFDLGDAVRGCLDLFGLSGIDDKPHGAERRVLPLINQRETFGSSIEYEAALAQSGDQRSGFTPERVLGGVVAEGEESVHDLLVKCQRELSRGHNAAAEDLAQRAIERDRKAVADDPLVRDSDLLQRVKVIAELPLGTVDPCAAKGAGCGIVPAGAAKAIGSKERMVEVLVEEFNTAYQAKRYREAEALAERARQLDPDNALVAAAVQFARMQHGIMRFRATPDAPAPAVPVVGVGMDNAGAESLSAAALVSFQGNFKEARYEEAKADALRALAVAPGNPLAAAAYQQACEALSRQPRPPSVPQCTYVGTNLRPALPAVDPAVVGALQKLLIESDKAGTFGGSEEAEPKDDGAKPLPRR